MTSSKNIIFRPEADKAFAYWRQTDPTMARKIAKLLRNIQETPFAGLGKPEPLKHELSGCWSRRIDQEHRLVYRLEKNAIIVLSCRYHYE